jgi:cell division protein FtsL
VSARVIALAVLLLSVVATGVSVVYARHQSRLAFIELSRLGNERDDLRVEYGRLQLEQATWAENNRIEQIARGRLGMVSPTVAETVVIRR